MEYGQIVYRASSIFKNFVGDKAVKVEWFKLMEYQDDPYFPWTNPDDMPSEDDWSRLIADYRCLDRRERWIARLYCC